MKKTVTPLLTHYSYVFLALAHRYAHRGVYSWCILLQTGDVDCLLDKGGEELPAYNPELWKARLVLCYSPSCAIDERNQASVTSRCRLSCHSVDGRPFTALLRWYRQWHDDGWGTTRGNQQNAGIITSNMDIIEIIHLKHDDQRNDDDVDDDCDDMK